MEPRFRNLVISGGGMRTIASMGVLDRLVELNLLDLHRIDRLVGVSAGAMICFTILLGYTPSEMLEFFGEFDFTKMMPDSWSLTSLVTRFGIDDGSKFRTLMATIAEKAGVDPAIDFGTFEQMTETELIICSVDMNLGELVYHSAEQTPDESVIDAVMMSSAVPGFFIPPRDAQGHLHLDGGCIDNYPFHLMRDRLDSSLGILLTECIEPVEQIDHLEQYLIRLFNLAVSQRSFYPICGYEPYTVLLKDDAHPGSLLDLEKGKEEIEQLAQLGRRSIDEYMEKYPKSAATTTTPEPHPPESEIAGESPETEETEETEETPAPDSPTASDNSSADRSDRCPK